MESIFEKRLTVTPDYCDASGALSPLAAFTIFQGIAAQHAEVLGVGSSAMAKKGEFWLTVHTRVDLFERAYLMDELTVRTWAEACSERDVRTYRSYTLLARRGGHCPRQDRVGHLRTGAEDHPLWRLRLPEGLPLPRRDGHPRKIAALPRKV